MAVLYYQSQFFTTALSVGGGINNSITTGIVIQSVSGIFDTSKPGVALLSYSDPLDTDVAEWITFTSINSTTKELQGVTRGAEGFSAKSHLNSATIAFPVSKSHVNNIAAKLDGTDTIDADLDLGSTYNIKYDSADPWRTIWLPAGVLKPTTTSGCAAATQVEAGTNDIDYDVIDFDTSSDESAYANIWMPNSWDAGAVQFRFIWTASGGSSAQTVVMELSGRSLANDDAIDQAVGTSIEVSDTWIADGDIHISSWSSDVTLTGAGAGEYVHVELMRDVSEDDLGVDARILGIQIRYKQGVYGD